VSTANRNIEESPPVFSETIGTIRAMPLFL